VWTFCISFVFECAERGQEAASTDIPMMRGSAKNHIGRTSHKIRFTEKCEGCDSPLFCDESRI
jgi:hypothetical protein